MYQGLVRRPHGAKSGAVDEEGISLFNYIPQRIGRTVLQRERMIAKRV